MAIPKHVFREYDIRGLTSTELTPDFAEALGRGFAAYLLEKSPGAQSIALGRDHRTSSPGLAGAFSRGMRAGGVDVWSIGIVPTPLTYFAAHTLPVDGLCMITGSHNPPEYNGFKRAIGRRTQGRPAGAGERVRGGQSLPALRHPDAERGAPAEGGGRCRERDRRDRGASPHARAGPRSDRAVLRAGRHVSQPPSRSHRPGEPPRPAGKGAHLEGGPGRRIRRRCRPGRR